MKSERVIYKDVKDTAPRQTRPAGRSKDPKDELTDDAAEWRRRIRTRLPSHSGKRKSIRKFVKFHFPRFNAFTRSDENYTLRAKN